jgi:hypothetical protein
MAFLVGVSRGAHRRPLRPDRIDDASNIAEYLRVRHAHDAIAFCIEAAAGLSASEVSTMLIRQRFLMVDLLWYASSIDEGHLRLTRERKT